MPTGRNVRRCSKAYAGIRLLEIMIHEAIHQGLRDHLWLHYLPIFTDKILRQMRAPLPQDLEHEFPSFFL